MKTCRVSVVLLLLSLLFAVSLHAAASDGVLVSFRDGFVPPATEGLSLIREKGGVYLAEDEALLEPFRDQIDILEPNERVPLIIGDAPAEPSAVRGAAKGVADAWQWTMIGVGSFWDADTYGNDVRVAVIDSGCSLHTDLADNILPGKNYFDGSTDVSDDVGHGTHVSGIIAAQLNDIGINGAAPGAKIVPLKCFKSGVSPTTAMLIDAIDDAVDVFGCRVINMSWGMTSDNAFLRLSLNEAANQGVILVASVGNKGTTEKMYPAAYDNVIGVGSVTQSKTRSSFSQYNSSVLVAAPGQLVTSTNGTGGYAVMSGTSQATPFVSALAALALSADDALTPARFRSLLVETCEDLGTAGYDTETGYGLIRADALFDALLRGKTCYVSPLNEENGAYFAYVRNTGESALSALGFLASYRGGKMEGLSLHDLTLLPNEGTRLTLPNNGAQNASLFLWDAKTFRPLTKKREKNAS